jgi:nucleotidyltransferase AbiEii toxin of type IV toxin-antitoxin system
MRKIADLGETERRELFAETATKKGITSAAAEKDFWLCWVLMVIFEHSDLSKILKLKGGTSLSKCYNLIDRFSEDIDLILDWTVLTRDDPNENRSKNQQNKFNEKLDELSVLYLENDFLPVLEAEIKLYCNAEIDEGNGQIINIEYPQVFSNQYLRPQIKLEIGPLASMVPFDNFSVKSYAAEVFPDLFELGQTNVTAVKAERTFWEKVTILHAEAHRPVDKAQPPRYSRHYYDVFKMLGTDIAQNSLNDPRLLEDVVSFKNRFYPRTWAKYDLAEVGTFKLVPNDMRIKSLRGDYAQMQEMIFGTYPDFGLIISELSLFQNKLNQMQ